MQKRPFRSKHDDKGSEENNSNHALHFWPFWSSLLLSLSPLVGRSGRCVVPMMFPITGQGREYVFLHTCPQPAGEAAQIGTHLQECTNGNLAQVLNTEYLPLLPDIPLNSGVAVGNNHAGDLGSEVQSEYITTYGYTRIRNTYVCIARRAP